MRGFDKNTFNIFDMFMIFAIVDIKKEFRVKMFYIIRIQEINK